MRLATILILGCSATTPQPCSETDAVLAMEHAECRARVDRECEDVPPAECPALKECHALIDKRCGQ